MRAHRFRPRAVSGKGSQPDHNAAWRRHRLLRRRRGGVADAPGARPAGGSRSRRAVGGGGGGEAPKRSRGVRPREAQSSGKSKRTVEDIVKELFGSRVVHHMPLETFLLAGASVT